MSRPPVSNEIGAAIAAFFHGGAGPSHSKLSTAFAAGGYADSDPYVQADGSPNKETRVNVVVGAAVRRPVTARGLVEALLLTLRQSGKFESDVDVDGKRLVRFLEQALGRQGWSLTPAGELTALAGIDLTTGGRAALDEQIDRLRRSTDDPGALLGTAKDLLEAVAKFILEELDIEVGRSADFGHLWHIARDRLGVLPQQVDATLPGAEPIRKILQSSWTIAEQVNVLRGLQGVGHGRTLPTGVTVDLALVVVREACSVAEFVLSTFDRQYGRST